MRSGTGLSSIDVLVRKRPLVRAALSSCANAWKPLFMCEEPSVFDRVVRDFMRRVTAVDWLGVGCVRPSARSPHEALATAVCHLAARHDVRSQRSREKSRVGGGG